MFVKNSVKDHSGVNRHMSKCNRKNRELKFYGQVFQLKRQKPGKNSLTNQQKQCLNRTKPNQCMVFFLRKENLTLNQVVFKGNFNQAGRVVHPQFAHDVFAVYADGLVANV
jgi:hypothetical protein